MGRKRIYENIENERIQLQDRLSRCEDIRKLDANVCHDCLGRRSTHWNVIFMKIFELFKLY